MSSFTKIPTRLKHNPLQFLKHFESKRRAMMGVNKTGVPAWVKAMQMVPPPPAPLTHIIPEETGSFVVAGGAESVWRAQMSDACRLNRRRLASRKTKNDHGMVGDWTQTATVPKPCITKPPEIVYDEDEIRRVFYRRHPFELARTRVLKQEEERLVDAVWTDIHGGKSQVPVTGESVVRRTMYLMTENGGKKPRQLAYKQALEEFYAYRVQEEEQEMNARSAAVSAADGDMTSILRDFQSVVGEAMNTTGSNAVMSVQEAQEKMHLEILQDKPMIAKIIKYEERELMDSDAFNSESEKMQQSRSMMQQRMSAFDQRNLKTNSEMK